MTEVPTVRGEQTGSKGFAEPGRPVMVRPGAQLTRRHREIAQAHRGLIPVHTGQFEFRGLEACGIATQWLAPPQPEDHAANLLNTR
jgi:hypothetical protein